MDNEVARTLPYGNMKVIDISGAAADTEVEVRPTKGFMWMIVDLWAVHDDGTNRALSWTYHDGADQVEKEGSGALAALTPWHFNQRSTSTPWSTVVLPPVLKHDDVGGVYMTVKADALTAGKKIHIRGIVYEMGDT